MSSMDIIALISRRRRQILVHSCIYYRFSDSIIDDYTYDMWSKELADLQEKYPDLAKKSAWNEEFKDFDGSTGFDLPIAHPWVVGTAQYLMKLHRERK